MILFEDLIGELINEANGCPDWILTRALRNASIEFFAETGRYIETGTITPIADTVSYEITYANPVVPVEVRYVITEDVTLDAQTLRRVELDTSSYVRIFSFDNNTFTFNAPPKEEIKYSVSVKPTITSTGIPDNLANDYFRTLQHGTMAEIQTMPDKAWSDPRLAGYNRDMFLSGIRSARERSSNIRRQARFSW